MNSPIALADEDDTHKKINYRTIKIMRKISK